MQVDMIRHRKIVLLTVRGKHDSNRVKFRPILSEKAALTCAWNEAHYSLFPE
jgi:hypothetical protein